MSASNPPAAARRPVPTGESGVPNRWSGVALALFASIWLLAFAPKAQTWAVAPGVIGMLALLERCKRTKHAIGYVFLFGTIAIGFGYRWLADTVRTFGEFDTRIGAFAAPASWLLLALYAMWSTIHVVVFTVLYRSLLRSGRRPHPIAVAALFVACEALPIRFLAWSAGYGAVECAPLRQLAEWGGVPLVSFALLCFAVPLHEGVRWTFARPAGGPGALVLAPRPKAAFATVVVGLALYGAGWWRLSVVDAEDRAATEHVRVGLVQANVGSTAKRDAEREDRKAAKASHDAYERWTKKARDAGAELIVWPESAFVDGSKVFWNAARQRPTRPEELDRRLTELGYPYLVDIGKDATLLLGGYIDEPRGSAKELVRYNVAMLREPGGPAWSFYRKLSLMPFGERVPGQDVFPSLRGLLPQTVPMSAGDPDQPPLVWRRRGLSITAFICYEAIAPTLVSRLSGDARPDLLVNLTNDSWYGDTWEPHQHLAFSRFRAVEQRSPMLRSTNTGISAIVSSTGEVTASAGVNAEEVVVGDVPIVSRPRTPYAKTAATQPYVWYLIGVVVVVLGRRRRS